MVRPDSEALSDASQGRSWSLQRRLAASLVICIGGTFAILFPVLDYWIDHEIYRRMDTTLMQRSAAVGRVLQELDARKRSEEHTSELQSRQYLVCRLPL